MVSDLPGRVAQARRWLWGVVVLAALAGIVVALVRRRPEVGKQAAPAPLAPLPRSPGTQPSDLWHCRDASIPLPRQIVSDKSGPKESRPYVGPGLRILGYVYVGQHRCSDQKLAGCENWVKWNVCRTRSGDLHFDSDGYVVAVRLHTANRGGLPFKDRFPGGRFNAGGLTLRLGVTKLNEVMSQDSEVGAPQTRADAEFGSLSILDFGFYELEFDPVGQDKVLSGVFVTR
jgi:hypothetical protein